MRAQKKEMTLHNCNVWKAMSSLLQGNQKEQISSPFNIEN